MKIQTSRKDLAVPAQPGTGLLIDYQDPPEELAERARVVLGLSSPPSSLMFGLPSGVITEAAATENALAKAAGEAAMAAAELASTELAKQISPKLGAAVKLGWLVVKADRLVKAWSDDDADVPVLMVKTLGLGFSALTATSDLSGIGGGVLTPDVRGGVGGLLTASGAIAGNKDVSMALFERQVTSDGVGKLLPVVSPLVGLALSDQPAFENFVFEPVPNLIANPSTAG